MDPLPSPPIPDSYWVLPGRLMAGEYPGAKEAAQARRKLRSFLAAGVTYFLDLTQPGELAPYAALLHEEAAALGQTAVHQRMAIPDLGTPSTAETKHILDAIDAALAAGQVVYVHCWGGVGRTGTIIGCYLVRHGLTGDEALAQIARMRHGTPDGYKPSPETQAQRARVLNWAMGG